MRESKGDSPTVSVQRLPHGADLPLPAYATAQSAGLDLMAAVSHDVTLAPGARQLIPTGLAIALPAGFEAQVRPRSGLAQAGGAESLPLSRAEPGPPYPPPSAGMAPGGGAQLVGEVVQYEDAYRLCYIRGTEGLLIGLAEQLNKK